MRELGVTESYKLKRQVVLSASEAAEMILRVDDSAFIFLPFLPRGSRTDDRSQFFGAHRGRGKEGTRALFGSE